MAVIRVSVVMSNPFSGARVAWSPAASGRLAAAGRDPQTPVGADEMRVGEHRLRWRRTLDETELAATGDTLVDAVAQRIDVDVEPVLELPAQVRHRCAHVRIVDAIRALAGIGAQVEELVRP